MRRFYPLFLFTILFFGFACRVVYTHAMTQVASDTFNRANGPLGVNWTTLLGAPGQPSIVSNQVTSPGATAHMLYYGGINWPTDQYAELQIMATNGGSTGPAVRMSDIGSNDYFYAGTIGSLGTGSANVFILVSDGSGQSVLVTTSTATVLSGDYVELSVQGSSLTLTDVTRSTTLLAATDTNISAGYPGFYEGNGGTLTNWNAGAATTPLSMGTLASDNFDRANSSTLGSNWTVVSPYCSIQVINNQIQSNCAGHAKEYYSAISWPSDQWSQTQVVAATNNLNGDVVRWQAGDDHYIGLVSATGGAGTCSVTLDRDDAGTPTVLGTDSTHCTVNPGDYIRTQAQGELISMIDATTGSLLLTSYDSTYAGGSPGIALIPVSAMSTADNWSGGGFGTLAANPTGLSAMPGNDQASLSWTTPASTGGFSLIEYYIEDKPDTSFTWTGVATAPANSTGTTINSLANGTVYDFRVSAINPIGTSTLSNVATATPAGAPDIPAGVSAVAGNAQATVSFLRLSMKGLRLRDISSLSARGMRQRLSCPVRPQLSASRMASTIPLP